MIKLKKRLKKLEKVIKSKYTHHGVFYILKNNDMFILRHYLDNDNEFNTREELKKYACNKYECEKYVFIDFSDICACLDENGKLKVNAENVY